MAPVRHVLLDFDGPVCSVFGELPAPVVAPRPAEAIDADLPDDVIGTDPLALLSVFAERGRDTLVAAEATLRQLEGQAVAVAPITPGVVMALDEFVRTGRTVTIVSNNSEFSIRTFLDSRLPEYDEVRICSRTSPDPALLKPAPHLLKLAMRRLGAQPTECVVIGDSLNDFAAAACSSIPAVGVLNKAEKRARFVGSPASPSALITSMGDFVSSASKRWTGIDPE